MRQGRCTVYYDSKSEKVTPYTFLRNTTQMNIFVDKEEYGANANMATSMELQPLRTLDKNMSASTVDFFETLNENVVANIAKIKTNVEEVKVLQRRILVSVKSDEKDAAENQMNNLVEESKRLSRKIQVRFNKTVVQLENVILTSHHAMPFSTLYLSHILLRNLHCIFILKKVLIFKILSNSKFY